MTTPRTDVRRVAFSGSRAVTAPFTWGQKEIWPGPADAFGIAILSGHVEVPAGLTVDAVADRISALLSRHEALRTYFFREEIGRSRQEVVAAGTLDVRVLALPHADIDPTERLAHNSPATFDPTRELSVEVVVVTTGGAPR